VLLNVTSGTPGISSSFTEFMSAPLGQNNPALGIQYDSQLAWILTLVCGGLFLLTAIFALVNMGREGHCIHFWLLLFCVERVATLVFRAILYKKQEVLWIQIFEILEAAGTAIIVSAAFQILAGFIRAKKRGSSCCVSTVQHFISLAAFLAISAGAGLFAAGAALQDRESATQAQFDKGFDLRQYAVIVYGSVLIVYNVMCLIVLCAPGKRGVAIELVIVGLALSAKVGFQLYALWMPDQPIGVLRYYSTRFFFSLLVFPELLALSFLTSRGFVRNAMIPAGNPLSGPGGYGPQVGPHGAMLPPQQQQFPPQFPPQHFPPQQRSYYAGSLGGDSLPPTERSGLNDGSPPSHGTPSEGTGSGRASAPPYQPRGPWATK